MSLIETEVMTFHRFKVAVAKQFERMQQHPMFRVGSADRDELWLLYLASFPPGTNPLFRTRTEHHCSCCRHFIRAVGDVVAVIDGKLVSIWDVTVPGEPAYQAVADALAKLVKSRRIEEPFLHYERTAGTDKNFEQLVGESVKTWDHFFVNVAPAFVAPKATIPSMLSEKRATHDVLGRALKEITVDAIDTALELIAQGSLYRGDEHKFALQKFRVLKTRYDALDNNVSAFAEIEKARATFVWLASREEPGSVSRIRGTVIGTLLTDLAEGKDLEAAVAAFEAKVAPTNYKRPTALVTPKMIEQAKATIAELGLTSALERRFAKLDDLTINNVLFADRGARRVMTGDVFDELTAEAGTRTGRVSSQVEEVPIDRFLAEVLPHVETIEVLLENRHAGNLVSLIAPANPTAGELFKWGNKFSWSYAGELADSIKERVKKAGGNVTGDLCCRLAWNNTDDLDLHLRGPAGHIYFGSRRDLSDGTLDVDANGMDGIRDNPVENIFYPDRARMREGSYKLAVNQYNRREMTNVGFEAEIDWLGDVRRFAYDKTLRQGETVEVAEFKYTRAGGVEIVTSLPASTATRQAWGLATQNFHRVAVLLRSPNHWDGEAVGNKHYFFMLDGCVNDGTARGFFNEFLKADLDKHRKVFEMVGAKLIVAPASEQLSGLGFSSTQKNTLTCRVKGSYTRTLKIVF